MPMVPLLRLTIYMQVPFRPLVSGYKTHTDCREDDEKRDRMGTILVYLQDVEDGGETKFPGTVTLADRYSIMVRFKVVLYSEVYLTLTKELLCSRVLWL